MQFACNSRLVHEQRERLYGQAGLQHDQEGRVARRRLRQRRCEGGLGRAAACTEHGVDVSCVGAFAREALADLRDELEHAGNASPSATDPQC